MANKFDILSISESVRNSSSNLNLIKAISVLSADTFSIDIYGGLVRLPPFNPDCDGENIAEEVIEFRRKLKDADGVLICTPEYAMGVPGVLKNALDWTVSSMDFSGKPLALITASVTGEKAHASLLETFYVIEAKMTPNTQLLVSFVESKVNDAGVVTDEETLVSISDLIQSFHGLISSAEYAA